MNESGHGLHSHVFRLKQATNAGEQEAPQDDRRHQGSDLRKENKTLRDERPCCALTTGIKMVKIGGFLKTVVCNIVGLP